MTAYALTPYEAHVVVLLRSAPRTVGELARELGLTVVEASGIAERMRPVLLEQRIADGMLYLTAAALFHELPKQAGQVAQDVPLHAIRRQNDAHRIGQVYQGWRPAPDERTGCWWTRARGEPGASRETCAIIQATMAEARRVTGRGPLGS